MGPLEGAPGGVQPAVEREMMHPKSPYKRIVSVLMLATALVSFFCGAVLLVYFILSGISGLTGSLISARMPGQVTLELSHTGSYTIFHEYTHRFEDGVESATDSEVEGMELTVTDGSGNEFQLQKPSGTSSYSLDDKSGYSLYWFEISEPGEYTLTGAFPESEETNSQAMLTLSNNFGGKLILLIGKCFAAVAIPGVIGLVFLILALRKPKES